MNNPQPPDVSNMIFEIAILHFKALISLKEKGLTKRDLLSGNYGEIKNIIGSMCDTLIDSPAVNDDLKNTVRRIKRSLQEDGLTIENSLNLMLDLRRELERKYPGISIPAVNARVSAEQRRLLQEKRRQREAAAEEPDVEMNGGRRKKTKKSKKSKKSRRKTLRRRA
jgi:hypothetical protein